MPDSLINLFTILEEQPRPWLDSEALKEKFHRLGAIQHPDLASGSAEQFARLNEAYRVLSDPALRLRHFIAVQFPDYASPANSATPADFADLFMEIGRLQQQARQFRDREAATQSPLAKALLISEQTALRTRLESTLTTVTTRQSDLFATLQRFAQSHPPLTSDPTLPPQLAAIAARLTFLARWQAQLREAIFSLA